MPQRPGPDRVSVPSTRSRTSPASAAPGKPGAPPAGSATDREIGDAQALAALPEFEARVDSRPVPGGLEPPVRLRYAEERVELQAFHAADLGGVRKDDQRPRQAVAFRLPFV